MRDSSLKKRNGQKKGNHKNGIFADYPITSRESMVRCRASTVFRSEKKKTFQKIADFWPLRPAGKSRLFIYLPLFAGATIDSCALLTGFRAAHTPYCTDAGRTYKKKKKPGEYFETSDETSGFFPQRLAVFGFMSGITYFHRFSLWTSPLLCSLPPDGITGSCSHVTPLIIVPKDLFTDC